MVTDVEKLTVQLSADLRSFENAMARASGITKGQLAEIKKNAADAGVTGARAFDGAAGGITRFGGAATKARGNVRQLGADTSNLVSQFQDIAVQLQGGASPLTIALQQGSQISQVL